MTIYRLHVCFSDVTSIHDFIKYYRSSEAREAAMIHHGCYLLTEWPTDCKKYHRDNPIPWPNGKKAMSYGIDVVQTED